MIGDGGGISNLLSEPLGSTASLALSSQIRAHLARQVQVLDLQSVAGAAVSSEEHSLGESLIGSRLPAIGSRLKTTARQKR